MKEPIALTMLIFQLMMKSNPLIEVSNKWVSHSTI